MNAVYKFDKLMSNYILDRCKKMIYIVFLPICNKLLYFTQTKYIDNYIIYIMEKNINLKIFKGQYAENVVT